METKGNKQSLIRPWIKTNKPKAIKDITGTAEEF